MKLTFLGTGSFFVLGDNFHSNMILEDEDKDKFLLIDCGTDIRRSLDDAGKEPTNIDGVYITHLHGDHAGGLEWLALMSYFYPDYEGKPTLYINKGMAEDVWDMIKGGICILDDKIATLNTYFDVVEVDQDEGFSWNGVKFDIVPSRHVINNDGYIMYSYGLSFEVDGKKYWITGDSCEARFYNSGLLKNQYKKHDVIFHDCETFEVSSVHSKYSEMKELPDEIKEKILLYHYQVDDMNPEDDGFAGFVRKGDKFTL